MIIRVDARGYVPLYEQVKSEIRRLAAAGAVKPHDPLPSIRELASDVLINPNTVARAYRELEQEGLIYTHKGRGSFLSARKSPDTGRVLDEHIDRKLDQAIAEVRELGLSVPEIQKRFEARLKRVQDNGRAGRSE